LPNPLPRLLVRHVEITQDTPGQWGGNCVATSIYSTNWPIECIAEAISRGERRKHAVLRFAKLSCNADADLKLAAAVLADLRKLTGRGLRAYTNHSE
jgi:hypothetical protein